jgi:hypothetical protein
MSKKDQALLDILAKAKITAQTAIVQIQADKECARKKLALDA